MDAVSDQSKKLAALLWRCQLFNKKGNSMEYKERHYPQLEVDLDKLEDNLRAMKSRMDASGIRLAGVVKGFNGLPWAARIYEKAGYSSIA